MLRRLHTRIVGMGAVCGMTPSPPAEVFLKSLPPPRETDPNKYHRFEREERTRAEKKETDSPTLSSSVAPEPFYDITHGAAGHKHAVLVTREGNLITFGENRYGQTAAPRQTTQSDETNTEKSTHAIDAERAALYIDLNGAFSSGKRAVVCGSNYTLVYQPDGRRVVAFGNNHMGQLGVGHKDPIDSTKGFAAWDATASFWGEGRHAIRSISCGFNHTVLHLTCGALLSCGSNTWGELGIGHTVSPMAPTRMTYFAEKGLEVVKVASGNSFSLFLTRDGRVYGCGATNSGQLPPNEFEPVPIPLVRSFEQTGGRHTASPSTRLIRVRDIACVGTMAVFLSQRGELLVQGSLPDYGLHIPAPRFVAIDQTSVMEHFRAQLSQQAWEMDANGFDIVRLVQGPSTLLVVYRNGCVAGFGANTEGQLYNIRRSHGGKVVNLAPAHSETKLFPVFTPTRHNMSGGEQPWFVCGAGFTLLFDNNEMYGIDESTKPIELPPGVQPRRTLRKLSSRQR